MGLFTKIFGDYSSKEVKRVKPIADKVMELEKEYAALSDEELQAKTPEFKERLAKGETLDDIPMSRLSAVSSCIRAVSPK